MRFSMMSDDDILKELAKRMEARRVQKEMSDSDFAQSSGTNISSIKRFRANNGTISLTSFIRILRGLGELDALNKVLEPMNYAPINEVMKTPVKKRIRKKNVSNVNFKWGDE